MNIQQTSEEYKQHEGKVVKSINKRTSALSNQGTFENKHN